MVNCIQYSKPAIKYNLGLDHTFNHNYGFLRIEKKNCCYNYLTILNNNLKYQMFHFQKKT